MKIECVFAAVLRLLLQDSRCISFGAAGTFLDSLKKTVILPRYSRLSGATVAMEEAMQEASQSAVSRFLRFLAIAPLYDDEDAGERDFGKSGDDRSAATAEIERKLAERDESNFWTWHYPGQW